MSKETNTIMEYGTSGIVQEVKVIIENGIKKAYHDANTTIVYTYWQVGKRIVEEEQNGKARAEYGKGLINFLSKELTVLYPKSYSPRDLRNYRQLYLCFRDLEIWYTRVPNLNWSHYRTLLHDVSDDARYWYVREAAREMWSVRTLARNVGSQYYHRLLQSPKKEAVVEEMLLCSETSEDIARYSVLNSNKKLFASKYLTYLPTEEELAKEIDRQKEIFRQQQIDNKGDE